MERWGDVFTSRQKLALITLIRLVQEVERKLKSEHNVDFALAVVSILACAIDREAEHSSSLCRWNPTGQKIQATFGHQTLRMLWDFSETNLLGGSVGSWSNVLECVLSTFETARYLLIGKAKLNVLVPQKAYYLMTLLKPSLLILLIMMQYRMLIYLIISMSGSNVQ